MRNGAYYNSIPDKIGNKYYKTPSGSWTRKPPKNNDKDKINV